MKTTSIKTLLGSIVVAGAIMSVPVSAFAANAHASTTASFYVNGDGIVHVINAEVTSISGNIVNAISRFKNNVVTWAFNTNASTTIFANNSGVASTADIKVGDKLNVVGALNTLGTTISVNATKIKDKTSMSLWRTKIGTIQSVNLTNGTFVLTENNGKSVTVQTNANTMFSLGNESPIANVLARLMVNSKVHVSGAIDSTGNTITASKVIVKTDEKKRLNKNDEDDDSHKKQHGFLKANLGLGFGDR